MVEVELEFLLRIVAQGIFENIEIAIILLKRIILFSRDLLFIFLLFKKESFVSLIFHFRLQNAFERIDLVSRVKKRFDISTIFLSLRHFPLRPKAKLHDCFLNTQVYFHFYLAALPVEETLRSLDSLFPHLVRNFSKAQLASRFLEKFSSLLPPFLLIESIEKCLSKYSFVSRVTVIEVREISPKFNNNF